jgi:cytoskeleton protein RodZ
MRMSTSEVSGEKRCGIGTRLRAAREARGLTTLQAAEKLHVDPRVLESLEAENFAALGATVYVRGHLRRYAELVGESSAELQGLYSEAAQASGPDLTLIPHRAPRAQSTRLAAFALLVLVAIAIAGVLWWLLTLPTARPQPISAAAPQPLPQAAPAAAAASPAGEASAAQLVNAVAAAQPAASSAAQGGARLALKFSAVSWVAVYDASGHQLAEGISAPDSARTLTGAPPLTVVLGNAPGVTVQLNGQKVPLEGLVRRDGSARFRLDASGHAAPMPPQLAHGG